MTPVRLTAIVKTHELDERRRRAGHPPKAHEAHADRGALLDLCRRLAGVIEEQARALGRECCPLCGDPECPAPLLGVLTGEDDR